MKRLPFTAVMLAAISALVLLWPSPPQRVNGQPWPHDEITVVGPEAKLVGDEFDVDVNISEVVAGYRGYMGYLEWDNTIVAHVDPPGVTYTGLGGMTLDAPPIVEADGVKFRSARVSGVTSQTGTAARVRLKCIGTGMSVLRLVSLAEDPAWGTALLGGGLQRFPELVDDEVTCMSDITTDGDGDGCSWYEEGFGSPSPNPGSTCTAVEPCYSDFTRHDFYDVPVPVNADPTPNGDSNKAVTMDDVLAVLFYVGTYHGDGGTANPNGVAYDSVKGSCDIDGDTVADKEGLCYDRSPSAAPNPPWNAGPPNGAVSMNDLMVLLPQVGLSCAEPP